MGTSPLSLKIFRASMTSPFFGVFCSCPAAPTCYPRLHAWSTSHLVHVATLVEVLWGPCFRSADVQLAIFDSRPQNFQRVEICVDIPMYPNFRPRRFNVKHEVFWASHTEFRPASECLPFRKTPMHRPTQRDGAIPSIQPRRRSLIKREATR